MSARSADLFFVPDTKPNTTHPPRRTVKNSFSRIWGDEVGDRAGEKQFFKDLGGDKRGDKAGEKQFFKDLVGIKGG